MKCPSRNEFKTNLEEKIGKMKTYGWQYVKIKCNNSNNKNNSDSDSDLDSDNEKEDKSII
jgi:hypothetical protein